ncbi:MAG: hypothetical protein HYU75_21010, partial [Betaproteobacteria bacterium]|nr:hypothetical protein [Betaproteobacteria bacterium]
MPRIEVRDLAPRDVVRELVHAVVLPGLIFRERNEQAAQAGDADAVQDRVAAARVQEDSGI